jgi:predicted protein tyrosine phosphatase
MSYMNRMYTSKNPHQGKFKKVLCVCSAGLLRSPTAALVLSQEPFNFNTRAAGLTDDFALVAVDEVLLHWADEIVVMDPFQKSSVEVKFLVNGLAPKPIVVLDIEDKYEYRNPELIKLIKENYVRSTDSGILE